MKQTTKTSRTAGYLEKIFRELNKDLFGGELEEPVITIQSTPSAYGHVTVAKTWKRKDDWRHELNIAAEYLQRPIELVVTTMIHEMSHLANIQHNVQDCSRGGLYHNQKFREEAEKHLITVEKDDKYGWCTTKPTDQLLEYILEKGWGDIEMGTNPLVGLLGMMGGSSDNGSSKPADDEKPKAKKPSSYRKHVCPKCGNIARTTKDFKLMCCDCMEIMIIED